MHEIIFKHLHHRFSSQVEINEKGKRTLNETNCVHRCRDNTNKISFSGVSQCRIWKKRCMYEMLVKYTTNQMKKNLS